MSRLSSSVRDQLVYAILLAGVSLATACAVDATGPRRSTPGRQLRDGIPCDSTHPPPGAVCLGGYIIPH